MLKLRKTALGAHANNFIWLMQGDTMHTTFNNVTFINVISIYQ